MGHWHVTLRSLAVALSLSPSLSLLFLPPPLYLSRHVSFKFSQSVGHTIKWSFRLLNREKKCLLYDLSQG